MLRTAVILSVTLLAACSSNERRYRLELDPLPAGSERQLTGTVVVGGVTQQIQAQLPLVREWTATSLSADLTSPGAGGMRMHLLVLPDGSTERDQVQEASGPLGVRGRIVERTGENTWGIELQMVPIPPPATP